MRYNSITGVYSDFLTRKDILDSIVKGTCYATTGERIILKFYINGNLMGSEIVAKKEETLKFELNVHGTDELDTVEVFSYLFMEARKETSFGEMRFEEDDPDVERMRNS